MFKKLLVAGVLVSCPFNSMVGVAKAPAATIQKHATREMSLEPIQPPKNAPMAPMVVKASPVEKTSPKPKPIGEHIKMEVTGYTAGYESTQKHRGETGFGLTASGNYVKQGVTIAAGKNIPFGTKIYIPYFDNQPGFDDGIFTVEDRGGAIGPYNIDVYYDGLAAAQNFGRHVLDVYIMEE